MTSDQSERRLTPTFAAVLVLEAVIILALWVLGRLFS